MTNDLTETRKIFHEDGDWWMELTPEELEKWRAQAPHLIRIISGVACTKVKLIKRQVES